MGKIFSEQFFCVQKNRREKHSIHTELGSLPFILSRDIWEALCRIKFSFMWRKTLLEYSSLYSKGENSSSYGILCTVTEAKRDAGPGDGKCRPPRIEQSEKSAINIYQGAGYIWTTEYSVTLMLWACAMRGFFKQCVELTMLGNRCSVTQIIEWVYSCSAKKNLDTLLLFQLQESQFYSSV
jgi:hypothetical protein